MDEKTRFYYVLCGYADGLHSWGYFYQATDLRHVEDCMHDITKIYDSDYQHCSLIAQSFGAHDGPLSIEDARVLLDDTPWYDYSNCQFVNSYDELRSHIHTTHQEVLNKKLGRS